MYIYSKRERNTQSTQNLVKSILAPENKAFKKKAHKLHVQSTFHSRVK